MSQLSGLSQFSESGLSDIIKDVDTFIEEHGIKSEVQDLLKGNSHNGLVIISEGAIEYKPNPTDFSGTSDYLQCDNVKFPPEEPQNIDTEEYSGPYNFEVLIIPNEQKSPWEYSSKLNKIFIGINVSFPVAFLVENRPDFNLFIRATPIYSQSQFFQDHVHRCVAHRHPQDNSNKDQPFHVFQHIIRCSNDQTKYFGDKNKAIRLSVVIPLGKPQTGSDFVKEFYHFVCKNSCPSGMNRRPIDVVFTLENENGEIFGRKLVSVKICSCPKRDRGKAELDTTLPKGKRKKTEPREESRISENSNLLDTEVYSINIVGKNNYLHLLKVARDRMASEILNSGGHEAFEKFYNETCSLIEKVEAE